MIANIELKSLDFDDENFSPVFNRATQEVFLAPGERFRADAARVIMVNILIQRLLLPLKP